MTELVRYRSFISDNARWEGFPFRDDDIIISTPPKCGTTWMQTLCAYLVFNTVDLPRPLAELSPWLDMLTNDRDAVVARLEAQTHRRFIKSHTPLDGLPFDENVTYICVGRDPRDASLSWEHHMANLDFSNLFAARASAVGLDDLAELEPPTPPSEDPKERFWLWVDTEGGDMIGATLANLLHHLKTFWDRRDQPNVALFHYSDLQADLPGEMRRLRDVLGVEVSDERVNELAEWATFDRMKQRADALVPDRDNRIWLSNTDFFHRGESGQWHAILDHEDLRRYDERVAQLVPPDLAEWAHAGSIKANSRG